MRNLVDLPTITNVAPSSHCVLTLPLGLTYDFIQFALTNVTPAQMTNFKVRIGSQNIVDVSSAQILEDQNTFYNRKTQSGFFTLWFFRPEEADNDTRSITSLGTADLQGVPVTVEFDLGVVSSPAITASAGCRPPAPMGLVTKIKEFNYSFAAAGAVAIADIPRAARIQAIHLQKSDITAVDFQINAGNGAVSVFKGTKSLLETVYKQAAPLARVPVTASYTHIDFNVLGELTGPMPTQNLADMRILPTLGTSGAVKAVVEYIDGRGGI